MEHAPNGSLDDLIKKTRGIKAVIRGVLRERMRPTVFPQGNRAQAGVKGTQRATNHEAMAEPCCRAKQMKKGTTDQ